MSMISSRRHVFATPRRDASGSVHALDLFAQGAKERHMQYADLGMFDRVRLRKPHPCGSSDWRVVRLGADIGLKCEGCGRRVLLPRSEVERRIKQILSRGAEEQATVSEHHHE